MKDYSKYHCKHQSRFKEELAQRLMHSPKKGRRDKFRLSKIFSQKTEIWLGTIENKKLGGSWENLPIPAMGGAGSGCGGGSRKLYQTENPLSNY